MKSNIIDAPKKNNPLFKVGDKVRIINYGALLWDRNGKLPYKKMKLSTDEVYLYDIMPELKSNWDGNLYKNLLINIKSCSNKTSNQICQSEEKIIKYINSANFAIYFTNLAIDSSNYHKPITTFARQLYTPISSNTLTYIEMLFGHINFSTDDGFFFEEIKNLESISLMYQLFINEN